VYPLLSCSVQRVDTVDTVDTPTVDTQSLLTPLLTNLCHDHLCSGVPQARNETTLHDKQTSLLSICLLLMPEAPLGKVEKAERKSTQGAFDAL
jgi:hypothetical protein